MFLVSQACFSKLSHTLFLSSFAILGTLSKNIPCKFKSLTLISINFSLCISMHAEDLQIGQYWSLYKFLLYINEHLWLEEFFPSQIKKEDFFSFSSNCWAIQLNLFLNFIKDLLWLHRSHFKFSTGPKVLQLELTSIIIHLSFLNDERSPLPTDCPHRTLDRVGRRWTITLQLGLSQPSISTPTETNASILPDRWFAIIFFLSPAGVIAVNISHLIFLFLIVSKVFSATAISGQNQAEMGFGLTAHLSLL